jgi:YVTN family beta-propeller protein
VSVIDTRAERVVATIRVGKRPRGLRVSPDGARLYVALSGSDGIGVVDLDKLHLLRTLEGGHDPEACDLVGDSELVVSNEETAEASLVDVTAGVVRTHLPVGHRPEGVTTDPEGKLVYVTSEADNKVTVIDPRLVKPVVDIPVGVHPHAIAFSPDSTRAFVTDEDDASITVIDARAKRVAGRIVLPAQDGSIAPHPMGVAVSRDGHRLYVTTGVAGSVAVLDPETRQIVRMIAGAGARPRGIAVAADGQLYTANGPSNDVSVIDPESGQVLVRLAVGHMPWGIAIDP